MPDNTRIRLVPSIQDQRGLVQSNYKTRFKWWEVVIDLNIFGQKRIGADGMAFWFTSEKGKIGSAFGRTEDFRGMGIFFDSYDNDHKGDNPIISAFLNNGTYYFDHEKYNASIIIVMAEIYLWDDVGLIIGTHLFLHKCGFSITNLGLSAMTGGFGDDHDVHSLATFSLTESESSQIKTPLNDDVVGNRREYDEIENFDQDVYSQNLRAIYSTNTQFAQQLELLGKLMLDIKQHMLNVKPDHPQSSNTENIFIKLNEINQLNQEISALSNIPSHLQRLKSDLHFISDQVHRVKVISSKCVGIYSLTMLMIIQFVGIIIILSIGRNRPHRMNL
ncbi:hypothetical protein MXB_1711 [Myxobolus squamalis]|nr:hypothetical protein MXB_1711 [Myxobolus squamalis]